MTPEVWKRAEVIDALLAAMATYPSQRIGQIIVNATGTSDPFYVEDDDLVRALEEYARRKP